MLSMQLDIAVKWLFYLDLVAHNCNISPQTAEAEGCFEFEASLGYE